MTEPAKQTLISVGGIAAVGAAIAGVLVFAPPRSDAPGVAPWASAFTSASVPTSAGPLVLPAAPPLNSATAPLMNSATVRPLQDFEIRFPSSAGLVPTTAGLLPRGFSPRVAAPAAGDAQP